METRTFRHPQGRQAITRILAAAIMVALLLSGCRSDASQATLPDDGPPPVTSQAAARRFVEKAIAAGESAASNGQFTLTVTEEEVNSFLTIGTRLLERFQSVPIEELDQIGPLPGLGPIEEVAEWKTLLKRIEGLPNIRLGDARIPLTIEEPQVYLRGDGSVIVRGYARLLRWRQPARVVVAPYAAGGEVELDFVEGQLGSTSMPEVIFDLIGKGIAEALVLGQTYAEVTEIRVSDGTLTLSGRRK